MLNALYRTLKPRGLMGLLEAEIRRSISGFIEMGVLNSNLKEGGKNHSEQELNVATQQIIIMRRCFWCRSCGWSISASSGSGRLCFHCWFRRYHRRLVHHPPIPRVWSSVHHWRIRWCLPLASHFPTGKLLPPLLIFSMCVCVWGGGALEKQCCALRS